MEKAKQEYPQMPPEKYEEFVREYRNLKYHQARRGVGMDAPPPATKRLGELLKKLNPANAIQIEKEVKERVAKEIEENPPLQ